MPWHPRDCQSKYCVCQLCGSQGHWAPQCWEMAPIPPPLMTPQFYCSKGKTLPKQNWMKVLKPPPYADDGSKWERRALQPWKWDGIRIAKWRKVVLGIATLQEIDFLQDLYWHQVFETRRQRCLMRVQPLRAHVFTLLKLFQLKMPIHSRPATMPPAHPAIVVDPVIGRIMARDGLVDPEIVREMARLRSRSPPAPKPPPPARDGHCYAAALREAMGPPIPHLAPRLAINDGVAYGSRAPGPRDAIAIQRPPPQFDIECLRCRGHSFRISLRKRAFVCHDEDCRTMIAMSDRTLREICCGDFEHSD
jgi:hypothetical protein